MVPPSLLFVDRCVTHCNNIAGRFHVTQYVICALYDALIVRVYVIKLYYSAYITCETFVCHISRTDYEHTRYMMENLKTFLSYVNFFFPQRYAFYIPLLRMKYSLSVEMHNFTKILYIFFKIIN